MNEQPNLSESKNLAQENPSQSVDTNITIDQFLNLIKLKTAKIISAVPVPNKDKLYELKLEVGNDTRTIVSGIREWYPNPEELVGKTIAIVSNLAPKKLGGILSEGMLLGALDDENHFSLLVTEKYVKTNAEVR